MQPTRSLTAKEAYVALSEKAHELYADLSKVSSLKGLYLPIRIDSKLIWLIGVSVRVDELIKQGKFQSRRMIGLPHSNAYCPILVILNASQAKQEQVYIFKSLV